jgi:hypothetical protein
MGPMDLEGEVVVDTHLTARWGPAGELPMPEARWVREVRVDVVGLRLVADPEDLKDPLGVVGRLAWTCHRQLLMFVTPLVRSVPGGRPALPQLVGLRKDPRGLLDRVAPVDAGDGLRPVQKVLQVPWGPVGEWLRHRPWDRAGDWGPAARQVEAIALMARLAVRPDRLMKSIVLKV